MTALLSRFPHRRAGHCGSGARRDLLEFHGLDYGDGPLSEDAVFGLAGGRGSSTWRTPPSGRAKRGAHGDGSPLIDTIRDLEHRGVELLERAL